jgi:hypothetical protein
MTRDPVMDCNLSNQHFGIGIPWGSVQTFRKTCRGRAYNTSSSLIPATCRCRGMISQRQPADGIDTVGFRLVRSSKEGQDAR